MRHLALIGKKLSKLERMPTYGGLTGSQFLLLPTIASFNTAPSLKEVSKENGTSHQNTRMLLNRLEDGKYVQVFADKYDYRVLRVFLTQKGDKAVETYYNEMRPLISNLYRDISEEDIEVTCRVLEILFERLDELHPATPGLPAKELV